MSWLSLTSSSASRQSWLRRMACTLVLISVLVMMAVRMVKTKRPAAQRAFFVILFWTSGGSPAITLFGRRWPRSSGSFRHHLLKAASTSRWVSTHLTNFPSAQYPTEASRSFRPSSRVPMLFSFQRLDYERPAESERGYRRMVVSVRTECEEGKRNGKRHPCSETGRAGKQLAEKWAVQRRVSRPEHEQIVGQEQRLVLVPARGHHEREGRVEPRLQKRTDAQASADVSQQEALCVGEHRSEDDLDGGAGGLLGGLGRGLGRGLGGSLDGGLLGGGLGSGLDGGLLGGGGLGGGLGSGLDGGLLGGGLLGGGGGHGYALSFWVFGYIASVATEMLDEPYELSSQDITSGSFYSLSVDDCDEHRGPGSVVGGFDSRHRLLGGRLLGTRTVTVCEAPPDDLRESVQVVSNVVRAGVLDDGQDGGVGALVRHETALTHALPELASGAGGDRRERGHFVVLSAGVDRQLAADEGTDADDIGVAPLGQVFDRLRGPVFEKLCYFQHDGFCNDLAMSSCNDHFSEPACVSTRSTAASDSRFL